MDVLIRVCHRRRSDSGSEFFEWRETKTTLSSIISLSEVEVTGKWGKEAERAKLIRYKNTHTYKVHSTDNL